MTGRERPWGERALIRRAWELVTARLGEDLAFDGDLTAGVPSTEAEALLAVAALDPIDVLVRGHAIVSREWMAAADPRRHVCGWCVKAALAAGTEEVDAYGQAERFDLDGVQGHTLSCKHNPLVQRINDLEAMRGRH